MDEATLEDPLGLTRVTIQTAHTRVDAAFPGAVAVIEILPHILRLAHIPATDDGSGWLLRTLSGQAIDPARSLDAQDIRDGEVLSLVPRTLDWPEPAPDDPLELITQASGRAGPRWSGRIRGPAFLIAGGLLLAWAMVAVAAAGPPWTPAGAFAFAGAVLLLLVATTISRSFAADQAGTALGIIASLYAFAGGVLTLIPKGSGLSGVNASAVLVGSTAAMIIGVLAALGVGTTPWLLAATVTSGLTGMVGSGLCLAGTSAAGAAAVVVVLAAGLIPAFPSLAVRIGRLPVPPVAANVAEILTDRPKQTPLLVYSAVARSMHLLTGMLLGASTVSAVAMVLLVRGGGASGVALTGCTGVVFALRTRAFPLIAQRVPPLLAAVVSTILLGQHALSHGTRVSPLAIASGAALFGLLLIFTGAAYRDREPGPVLGRAADILDAFATLAFVPLACGALGVFGLIRALAT